MADPEIETVSYDEVAAAYREGLVNLLRGFRVGPDFLQLWVDHEDVVEAALSLFEAAAGHGLSALRVRFSVSRNLDVARLTAAAASSLGDVSFRREAEGVEVTVRFVAGRQTATLPRRDARAAESLVRVAEEARDTAEGDAWALADAYRAAAASRVLAHTGSPPEGHGKLVALESRLSGVVLRAWVSVGGERVLAARFEGAAGDAAGVLEALCAEIEGVPLREAVDHGASRAELALRDRRAARPVLGIVLPENACPALASAQRLLWGLLDAWRAEGRTLPQESRYHRGPAEAWRALGSDAQRALVTDALRALLPQLGAAVDALRCARVVQSERVVMTFDEGVSSASRGGLLMQVERELKTRLDASLYIQIEERKDANKLRRL